MSLRRASAPLFAGQHIFHENYYVAAGKDASWLQISLADLLIRPRKNSRLRRTS